MSLYFPFRFFQDEFLATAEPIYWRTAEEMYAPFDDKKYRVMRSRLRVLAMETQNNKCGWRERWLMSNKQGEKTLSA